MLLVGYKISYNETPPNVARWILNILTGHIK
jgi:hypothetical protein